MSLGDECGGPSKATRKKAAAPTKKKSKRIGNSSSTSSSAAAKGSSKSQSRKKSFVALPDDDEADEQQPRPPTLPQVLLQFGLTPLRLCLSLCLAAAVAATACASIPPPYPPPTSPPPYPPPTSPPPRSPPPSSAPLAPSRSPPPPRIHSPLPFPPPPPSPIGLPNPPPSPSPPPPPPPRLPPRPPPTEVVSRINSRFRNFVPRSSRLEDIGVILHGIDGFEDKQKPWRAADPSSGEGFLSDRISASIVYAGKGLSFSTDSTMGTYLKVGSYIFDPFQINVLCAYGGDGATRGKTCSPPGASETCIPACMPHYNAGTHNSQNQWDRWCVPRGAADYACDFRPWRPRDIGAMLEKDRAATQQHAVRDEHHSYNEIVIDGQHSNAHLPRPIEAFVVSRAAGDDFDRARSYHQSFLREYGLSEAAVPMLEYRPGGGGDVFFRV